MSVFIHLKLALQCFSTKLILFWKSKRSIIYPFFWNKLVPSCCFTTWQHKQGKLFFKTGHSSLKQCVWGCKTKWFERQRASACDVSHRLCLNRKHRLSPKWGLRQRETERGAFVHHLDTFTSTMRTDDGHCIHTLTHRFYTDIHKGYKMYLTWFWTL